MDLFSLADSRIERDKAIAKVSLNNPCFMDEAIKQLGKFQTSMGVSEFTGEDLRVWLQSYDIFPLHPNAWGALISTAVKRKLIVPTGSYTQMKSRSSHARKTAVYKWA